MCMCINVTIIFLCTIICPISQCSFNRTEDRVITPMPFDLNSVSICNFPWIYYWPATARKYPDYKIHDKQSVGWSFAENQIFQRGHAELIGLIKSTDRNFKAGRGHLILPNRKGSLVNLVALVTPTALSMKSSFQRQIEVESGRGAKNESASTESQMSYETRLSIF